MKRYHPALVAMHWIVAIMIFMALVIGGPMMADLKSTDPQKLSGLTGHMIWGSVVGALLIIRLITRFGTQKPPKADAKNGLLNMGAQVAHWGLYLLAMAMVASGLGIAASAGLFDIAFGGSGVPLPEDFSIYPPRVAHGIIGNLLLVLIVAHIAGWAYHQFILRDSLISRMWFGKRKAD